MTTANPVAFVLPNMRGGGAERVALAVVEKLVATGQPVDLVLQQATGDLLPLVPAVVRIIDLDAPRLRNIVRPLTRYLRTERPRAVQASMWPLTVCTVMAHRRARSNAVLAVSEHIVLSQQYAGRGLAHRAFLRGSLAYYYRLADARIAVSRGVADDLRDLSGIPADRFEIIYNPIPRPTPAPVTPELLRRLWGDASHPRILTLGSLNAQKNHALLLEAFARLRRRRKARLAILGQGERLRDLQAQAALLGISDDVAFPGFLTDPAPAYSSADLFVLSSDYEGFGNVLVEALHWGLPVVSTDCPSGPSEILEGGRYGTLVPCRDAEALAAAMDDALSRPVDKAAQQARARAISGDGSIDDYLRVLGISSFGGTNAPTA